MWPSVRCSCVQSGSGPGYGVVRCPVLTSGIVQCTVWYWQSIQCYAQSGVDIAYGAPVLPGARVPIVADLSDSRPVAAISRYTFTMRCAVLTYSMLLQVATRFQDFVRAS